MNKLVIAIASLLPLAAAAADGDGRQAFPGFSLVPPAGDAWTLANRSDSSLLWIRDTGNPDSNFAFAIIAGQAPASVRTREDLVAFLDRLGDAPPPSPNLELVSSRAEAADGPSPACARHDAVVKDKGAGTLLSVAGITCLHPDYPGRMFDVQYSQRAAEGQLDEALNAEGEALLKTFRFEDAPDDDNWSLSGGAQPPHPGG